MSSKQTPTYDLNSIKAAFDCPEKLVMTTSAKQGQVELDFTDEDVVNAIQSLAQGIYKTHFKGVELYIKFQINVKRELILSFKEK